MRDVDRYAPGVVLVVKDGKAQYALVTQTVAHPAGAHPKGCPLRPDVCALELRTEIGSRWYGCESASIDSSLRMRVCGLNVANELTRRWDVAEAE